MFNFNISGLSYLVTSFILLVIALKLKAVKFVDNVESNKDKEKQKSEAKGESKSASSNINAVKLG